MKDFVRRLVPRSIRNALRRPSLTLAHLTEGIAWRLGRHETCNLRPDWSFPCHPASMRAFLLHKHETEFRSELDSFVTRCREGMVLFDVGAHYGIFALAALRFGGPNARVVAVEPSPEASSILRANISLAEDPGRATILQAAAGASEGVLRMLTTGPNGENFMIGTDEARPDVTEIPQRTLASIAASSALVPTHVKIDVEGFEGEVIEGGSELLAGAKPIVFLELHGDILRGRGRSPRAVLATLEGLGFKRFTHDGAPIAPDDAASRRIVRIICDAGEAVP